MNSLVDSSDAHPLRIALLVLFGVGLATIPSYSQEAPTPSTTGGAVKISGLQPLISESKSYRQVETVLAVNPSDPDNLIAAAVAHSSSVHNSVVYSSQDGGDTWTQAQSPDGPVFPEGDPTLTFDGEGRAYFGTLAAGVTVWRSEDGGRTWTKAGAVKETYDRPWVAASNDTTRDPPPVYVAGRAGKNPLSVVGLISRDRAQSFTEITRVPQKRGERHSVLHSVTDLVIRDDGTLLVPYLVHHGRTMGSDSLLEGERNILISEDGGDSWSGPHPVADNRTYGNAGPENLVLKGLGVGELAVDETGGRFDDSAYLTWTQVVDGHHQIVVARSRDGGRSWNDPVRVNSGGHDSHHSTPSVAVNKDGVVAVTWNDRRHDPEGNCYHHYVAISRDGGQSFSSGRRISEEETCFPSDYRWLNGGDTQGLVALPNGNFRTVFTGPGSKRVKPWTAVVHVN